MKALGIKDCHIQMERLSVEIQYDHSRSSPIAACTGAFNAENVPILRGLTALSAGYLTRRSYTITLEKNNLDLLEKLVAAGLGNGAHSVASFRVDRHSDTRSRR